MNEKPAPTARETVDALGRAPMQARLGVSKQTMSGVYRDDRFPASWYPIVREMCEAAGRACPLAMFNFREPAAEADAA